jgi:transposase
MEMIRQQIPYHEMESLHPHPHPHPQSEEAMLALPEIKPLDNASWEKIVSRLRGKTKARALRGKETRRFVEVVLWVTDNELCWNHVPASYGKWHTIYVRFGRWALAYTWDQLAAVLDDQDSVARLQRRVSSYLASRRARKIPKAGAACFAEGP